MRPSLQLPASQLLLIALASSHARADINEHEYDEGLFSFVSRPDIRAPKWDVNIVEPDLVTPGYWFTAPFEWINQRESGNGWIGPQIYDGNGELVWSGVHISESWNVIDFRKSIVRGQEMLTFQLQHEANGYILDPNTYEVKEKVDLGTWGVDYNSHEFYFLEDGTRAITIGEGRGNVTEEQKKAIKWEEKDCRALFNTFKEWDTETWETVFEWSVYDHVGLDESTFQTDDYEKGCYNGWGYDYVHLNSVDKDHNGDYYVSARHADTIFKVSKDDGHIIWRLRGNSDRQGNDFDSPDISFSRQHNVRFRGFNGTHEFISILDNAKGEDDQLPSNDFSRGLLIALNPTEKIAHLVSSIDHPGGAGSYAHRRGNYQVLPSSEHIFMGWSEQATHSEHTPDGRLVMSATLQTDWLGTYRSYKFPPHVARPHEPPIAVSQAYDSAYRNDSTTTAVHVSWNGATEVRYWNVYKTTEMGDIVVPVLTGQNKTGFETALVWDGFAAYVFVEGVDAQGKSLGNTSVIETKRPRSMSGAVADEMLWLQQGGEIPAFVVERTMMSSQSLLLFSLGVVSTLAVLSLLWVARLKGLIPSSSLEERRFARLEEDERDGLLDEKGKGEGRRASMYDV